MALTPELMLIAHRFLTAAIDKNKVKTEAAERQHHGRDMMPPAAAYEQKQRDDETEMLRVLLANLSVLSEPAKKPRK